MVNLDRTDVIEQRVWYTPVLSMLVSANLVIMNDESQENNLLLLLLPLSFLAYISKFTLQIIIDRWN